ncbi:MAG: asparaginase, partial [Oscillospiraceae bacterium]
MDYEILTEEYRGKLLDLIHEGYVCVVNDQGKIIGSAGDPEAQVFYRSASKPLQAMPVIARNLDLKYGLTPEETVIFSGSHLAEDFHINALESIYQKAGLQEGDLIMKPTVPGSTAANEERIRKGLPPRKLYHNCSGKHTALMLLQRELGGDIRDYWKVNSLAQREVMKTICALSEFPENETDIGIDGCGVPVFAVPMRNIAIAFKNLACIDTITDDNLRQTAARYVPLIHQYPLMMRGTGFICSLIDTDENIVAKGGANGVYGLGLKKERIGVSIKIK